MAASKDFGEWALATLKAASSVTDLLIGGADAVYETGELNAPALTEAQRTRRETAQNSKALAVLVWDRGEEDKGDARVAYCSVYVYDRGAGYVNVRVVREAVILALVNQNVLLERDAIINTVRYAGRTGHQRIDEFELDVERVDFTGALVGEMDIYR
jgi:hypothetical protein